MLTPTRQVLALSCEYPATFWTKGFWQSRHSNLPQICEARVFQSRLVLKIGALACYGTCILAPGIEVLFLKASTCFGIPLCLYCLPATTVMYLFKGFLWLFGTDFSFRLWTRQGDSLWLHTNSAYLQQRFSPANRFIGMTVATRARPFSRCTMFTWWSVTFIWTVTAFIPPYTCLQLTLPCNYKNTCHFVRTLLILHKLWFLCSFRGGYIT